MIFSKTCVTQFVLQFRRLRNLVPPKIYDDQFKLPMVDKVPPLHGVVKMPKMMRRNIDIRGPELVHDKLFHEQFGIVAVHGGNLTHAHFEFIRNFINRRVKENKLFAVWRVDSPWKPVTKKGQGLRMGGGKAPIHHYVTPVKSGRVILEVGGKIEYWQVKPWLADLAKQLPFSAKTICHENFMDQDSSELPSKINLNPYSMEFCIKNRMQGCYNWLSKHDYVWLGKHR